MSRNSALLAAAWHTAIARGLVSLLAMGLAGCAATSRSVDPIVEPQQAAALLRENPPRVRVLDVRPADAFRKGHVAGATRLDPTQWKTDSLDQTAGIEDEAVWRKRIADAGIALGDELLVVDAGNMVDAARVWFILQHLGASRARIGNGGMKALAGKVETKTGDAAPLTESATAAVPAAANSDTAKRAARAGVGLAGREEVKQTVARRDSQIWDARASDEYSGAKKHKNPRGGHLPGAINLSHEELLDANGLLLPADALREKLSRAGLRPDQPIVTHCESGGRASLAAVAAIRAGFGTVSNYYRSFSDWSADASCPLESSPASRPTP